MMLESFSLTADLLKIFAVLYGAVASAILVYGIISVLSRRTRVFKDEGSSYGLSKPLTIIDSAINRSFKPFIYHRVLPQDSEPLSDDPAILVGCGYIFLGLVMLLTLIWAYMKLK